jgi:hypothetical protein
VALEIWDFEMFDSELPLTAYCAKRPEPACPEFIEWVEGLTAYY